MSVFSKNRTKVTRKYYLPKVGLAATIPVPKGATNVEVYSRNTTATAVNVSAGNALSGAQFSAATAVPTGTVTNPGVANHLDIMTAAGKFYVYPADDFIYITASVANIADVVVQFDELLASLPLMKSGSYATGQAGPNGEGQ